jgi:hypothetical protein
MTVKQITVRLDPRQRATDQFVSLDGVRIGLRFRLSSIPRKWSLWLLSVSGDQLAGPIAVVPGLDLLRPYKHMPGVPPGELFVHGPPADDQNVDQESVVLYREVAT